MSPPGSTQPSLPELLYLITPARLSISPGLKCKGFRTVVQGVLSKPILKETIESIPTVPWAVNASIHSARISRRIRESLCQAFPRQKRLRQNQVASMESRELCAL